MKPNLFYVFTEDVKSLDRSAPTSGGTNGSLDDDHQRYQYVPDETVVGRSATLREYDDESSDEEEALEIEKKTQVWPLTQFFRLAFCK